MRSPYVIVAAAALATSACHGGGGSAGHVRMPARNASPADVVRAYLSALNMHDRSTALRLLSPSHRAVVKEEVDSPLTDVRSITHVSIGSPAPQAGAKGWDIVDVPVHFNLSQYHAESMPNGPTDWGYLVGRAHATDPWRIVDEGVG